MPYSTLAQFQITQYLTPENIAALVAGFGALTAGIGYAIRQAFEIRRINAQAIAEDTKSENEQQTALINILGEQVNMHRDFKNELVEIRRDQGQHNEKIAGALNDYTRQTIALRQDLKAWPEAMSGSVSVLADTVKSHDEQVQEKLINLEAVVSGLQKTMDQKQADETILNSVKEIMEHWKSDRAKIAAIHSIVSAWDTPPPEPDSAPSRTQAKIVQADAGDASAVRPEDRDELRPTG